MDAGPLLGQVAQVASGDPPHHLGGCPAQAWSVAELARTLHELLD
jgi:glycogen debranching enzyme